MAFKLIHFLGEKIRGGKRSCDIVLSSYIRYDDVKNCLFSKFKPPPYEDSDLLEISFIVKNKLPAPQNWLEYKIKILGEAGK